MKALIALSLVVVASVATAQTKSKRTRVLGPAPTAVASSNTLSTTAGTSARDWKEDHVTMGVLLGTVTEMKGVELSLQGKKVGDGEMSTSNQIGFQAQYENEWVGPWKWTTGMSLYREQNLDAYNGTANGAAAKLKLKNTPSFQPWVVAVGAKYILNPMVYFPIALNTTIINNTQKGEMKSFSMSPQIGYQFGAGARLNKNMAIEMGYQRLAYSMDAQLERNGAEAKFGGDVYLEGLNIQGRYMF